jgi:hypothetical protein
LPIHPAPYKMQLLIFATAEYCRLPKDTNQSKINSTEDNITSLSRPFCSCVVCCHTIHYRTASTPTVYTAETNNTENVQNVKRQLSQNKLNLSAMLITNSHEHKQKLYPTAIIPSVKKCFPYTFKSAIGYHAKPGTARQAMFV